MARQPLPILLALALGLALAGGVSAQLLRPEPAARVDDQVITEKELTARVREAERRIQGFKDSPASRRQVLLELVRLAVIRKAARELGIREPNDEAAARSIEEKIPKEERERIMAALGWSQETLLARWKERALLVQVVEKVGGEVHLSEEELRSFYSSQKDLFTEAERALLAAALFHSRQEASAAAARVRAGTPFSEVAKGSLEVHSRLKAGEPGWVEVARLPRELQGPVSRAAPGDLIGPISSPHGSWLLEVREKIPARVRPFEEVRDEVMFWAERARKVERVVAWLNQAMDSASVWVNPKYGVWSRGARIIVPLEQAPGSPTL